ncbi:MAG: hypothetical protein Q4Q03_00455 [Bowdeniella nasicola]|nr:hypothetical protein [Bowdeniella nasicola]
MKRTLLALVSAALVLSGCGPKEPADGRVQRVVLDIPFGPTSLQEGKE